MGTGKAKILTIAVTVTILVILAAVLFLPRWMTNPHVQEKPGYLIVQEAYLNRESDLMVEVAGTVVRMLADEGSGVPQQRFVIELLDGRRLLVLHDLKSGDRVPIALGDQVTVRGEYRWSEPGGSLHWTHREGSRDDRDGWIRHEGRRYD
jgi:hypothetical protein